MAIITLDALKTFLGISTSSQDAKLTQIVNGVEAAFRTALGRDLDSTTYTEYYSGNGTRFLILRQRPVTSVTSIYLDYQGYYGVPTDSFGSTTLLTSGDDYVLVKDWTLASTAVSKSGMVARIGGVWNLTTPRFPQGVLAGEPGPNIGNIKVTYVAGYSTIPADLTLAALQTAAWVRRTASTGGREIQSESLGDYSVSLAAESAMATPELGSVTRTIRRYKEIAI